jgi:hypothetical protein
MRASWPVRPRWDRPRSGVIRRAGTRLFGPPGWTDCGGLCGTRNGLSSTMFSVGRTQEPRFRREPTIGRSLRHRRPVPPLIRRHDAPETAGEIHWLITTGSCRDYGPPRRHRRPVSRRQTTRTPSPINRKWTDSTVIVGRNPRCPHRAVPPALAQPAVRAVDYPCGRTLRHTADRLDRLRRPSADGSGPTRATSSSGCGATSRQSRLARGCGRRRVTRGVALGHAV